LQCDLFDDQLTGLKQETAEGLVDDGSALFGYVQFNQDSSTAVEFQFVEADSPKPPTEDLQQEKIHLLQRLKDLEERQQLHKKLEQIELLQQQQQKLKSNGVNLHTQLLAQQLTAPLSPPQSPVVKELTPQHSAQQQFQLTSLQQQLMQQQFVQDSASTSQTQNCTSKLLVQQVATLTSPPLAQQNSSIWPDHYHVCAANDSYSHCSSEANFCCASTSWLTACSCSAGIMTLLLATLLAKASSASASIEYIT
jgi:hypothetical protein